MINGRCHSECIDVPEAILRQIQGSDISHGPVIKWLAEALGVETRRGFATSPTLKVLPDGSGYFYRAGFADLIRFSLPHRVTEKKNPGVGK